MIPHLTIGDKVLAVFLVCAVAGSFLLVDALAVPGTTVLVEVGGRVVQKGNLLEDQVMVVRGREGDLTVEIREGKVAVTAAACLNHICVRTGWRSRVGDVIVCVPNKCVVRILDSDEERVHAITG